MTPEEFIRLNPFPENGSELNNQLVRDIQNPEKAHLKEANTYLLFKTNARLIYMIYQQYNYNQELASVMSFVYEGIKKATATFDPNVGMPFYHYAVQTTRGLMQNYYNYNNDIVHVPVMKRKDTKIDFEDINDYVEHEYFMVGEDNPAMSEHDTPNDMSKDLDALLVEYEYRSAITDKVKEDFDIFKMSRTMALKDIAERTNLSTARVRKMIDRAVKRLKKFRCKLDLELK
jgi:RNA polymerase sigma factor (sigma-70 family)